MGAGGYAGAVSSVSLIAALLLLSADRAVPACRRSCAEPVVACRQAECGALAGRARHRCLRACRARSTCTAPGAAIRTIAYVVTECRNDPRGFVSGSQKLFVRRGNCDPVPVMELPVPTVRDPFFAPFGGVCFLYGDARFGPYILWSQPFQRMGVLPDASGVVFEVTNDTVGGLFRYATAEPPEEGIFFVRADGSGLRKLGPPSRYPLTTIVFDPTSPSPLGIVLVQNGTEIYSIGPSGRRLVFTDLGPGPDRQDANQIFILDIVSG